METPFCILETPLLRWTRWDVFPIGQVNSPHSLRLLNCESIASAASTSRISHRKALPDVFPQSPFPQGPNAARDGSNSR